MLVALVLALALPETPALPTPKPSPDLVRTLRLECRDGDAVLPTLSNGLKATDVAVAKASFEAVIANCGDTRASDPARVFRAQIAWREGDPAGVLSWLKGVPRIGPSQLNLRASMLVMKADQSLGDRAGFAAERSAVVAATERALASRGSKLDSFDVGGNRVEAYDAPLDQHPFRRLIEFVISPADPNVLPQSIMLTDDTNVRAMFKQISKGGEAPPYYLDAYTCTSHQTIKMIAGHADAPPTYQEVKPLVVAYLTTGVWATATAKGDGVACAWPQYVAPGITN